MRPGHPVHDAPDVRKARGAFFTPPALCEYLAGWALRDPGDTVLEPSCGDAEFLLAAGRRLRDLGAGAPALHGSELHAASASAAARRLAGAGLAADITVGDFFARPPEPSFDAVVGNPPYVRYQGFAGDARAAAHRAALAAGVRLSGLASSWAAFTVHASRFLVPEGRLALVLPAELLSVNYAAQVRAYLMRRFARVRLVLFTERVFPGVQEEVVLLQAEGAGPTDHCELHQVADVDALLGSDLVVSRWSPVEPSGKWTHALVDPAARALLTAASAGGYSTLGAWGETRLGAVTGDNGFFAVSPAQIEELGLGDDDVVRISPPGSRHLRRTLDLAPGAWQSLGLAGRATHLLWPSGAPSPAAARYIAAGESDGVAGAYKCRTRTPWWRTPLLPPPDLLVTYMNDDSPRLVGNSCGVHHLNSVHGHYLTAAHRTTGRRLLPIASLNSLTMLGAEVVGRAYGGGLLKLEPREADQLPVPSPGLAGDVAAGLEDVRDDVAASIAAGHVDAAVRRVDAVVLTRGLGLRAADVDVIRAARASLAARRTARKRARR